LESLPTLIYSRQSRQQTGVVDAPLDLCWWDAGAGDDNLALLAPPFPFCDCVSDILPGVSWKILAEVPLLQPPFVLRSAGSEALVLQSGHDIGERFALDDEQAVNVRFVRLPRIVHVRLAEMPKCGGVLDDVVGEVQSRSTEIRRRANAVTLALFCIKAGPMRPSKGDGRREVRRRLMGEMGVVMAGLSGNGKKRLGKWCRASRL